MLDVDKINQYKKVGLGVAIIIIFILGFALGQIGRPNQRRTEKAAQTTQSQEKTEQLTQKKIKSFLIDYFTKKDLGENRQRYKEHMTEGLYNQIVAQEEAPTSLTYKGFVVDFSFSDATIWIDRVNNTALVEVTYTNTLLAKKNNYDQAQTDVGNSSTLRLSYTEVNGKLLLNGIEPIVLSDTADSDNDTPIITFDNVNE